MPVPGDTSSPRTIEQIQSWLRQCLQAHHNCQAHSNTKLLPTRLLDLTLWGKTQKLRLVESKQFGKEIRYRFKSSMGYKHYCFYIDDLSKFGTSAKLNFAKSSSHDVFTCRRRDEQA
jgi:hypothetical protein